MSKKYTSVIFIQTRRDCPYNEQQAKEVRPRFIYDYNVMRGDELVAVFIRDTTSRGYYLLDREEEQISNPDLRESILPYYRRITALKVQDFGQVFREADARGLIPTVAQLEERKQLRLRQQEQKKAAEADHERLLKIQAAAPELLEALKVAKLWLCDNDRFNMQIIDDAIAKAEGKS